MKAFADLILTLGTTTKTNEKLEALVAYFAAAGDRDKVWVIAIFSGRRPKRSLPSARLRDWCLEITGMPDWLFEESYHTVGDLGETLSLLLPEGQAVSARSLSEYLDIFLRLDKADEETRKDFVLGAWKEMNRGEQFVFNKLITGNFRIGVSQKMMVNALARLVDLDASVIAHRISGNWDPAVITFGELMGAHTGAADPSKPYPFYLAYALEEDPAVLGDAADWFAEWKWDGIRGQLIRRQGERFVWSRGEELLTEKFPEYAPLTDWLPEGTVLDGEIICLDLSAPGVHPLPFSLLQTRIGRKNISRKQLTEAPVGFVVYDLLEYGGTDFRDRTQAERRLRLEEILGALPEAASDIIRLSPLIAFSGWAELTEIRTRARDNGSEGVMLKRRSAIYQTGRKRGDWWKWKTDPLVIDAVMVYAQKGHGRRSNLYTDYTFAVRDGDQLITFTKAYSGLTDKEFNEVDQFVKRNSIEKFGPVRTVRPELVFEIAFEGIALSKRHKSGVALRFPRISRWRKDKPVSEINTLQDLQGMLDVYGT